MDQKYHHPPPFVKIAPVKSSSRSPRDYSLVIPDRATAGASGFDLRAIERHILSPGNRKLIPTGWKIEISPGWEGQIRPRSGLALKHGITVLNAPGTIDSDYRGEVGAILYNASETNFVIESGERIAQLVICPVWTGQLMLVEELSETERGEQGYGSTGIK
jgi:dUTP pyrophosphatase